MRYIAKQYLGGIHLTSYTGSPILPGMARVQVWAWVCERCTHQWLPREKDREPRVCPKCKSPYWNTPRRDKAGKASPEA